MLEVGEKERESACHEKHHNRRNEGVLGQKGGRTCEDVEVVPSVESFIQLSQTSHTLDSEAKLEEVFT